MLHACKDVCPVAMGSSVLATKPLNQVLIHEVKVHQCDTHLPRSFGVEVIATRGRAREARVSDQAMSAAMLQDSVGMHTSEGTRKGIPILKGQEIPAEMKCKEGQDVVMGSAQGGAKLAKAIKMLTNRLPGKKGDIIKSHQ